MSEYNDTNLGVGFVYDTPEDKEIERLNKKITALQAEKERLEGEVERLCKVEEAVNEWYRQRMYQKNNPGECTELFNDVTDSYLFGIIGNSDPTQEPSE